VAPEEAGSSPAGHTARDLVINGASYALPAGSIPALATMGRWRNRKRSSPARRRLRVRVPHGPPTRALNADVAQSEEARRSDRRQCGFDSRRQYQTHLTWVVRREPGYPARGRSLLDVVQRKRAGFGSRRSGVRISPSRPTDPSVRGGGTGTTPASEAGAPGSSPGLAANDASAVVAHLDTRVGLLRRRGFLRRLWSGFESRRLRA
jgi:hypothetical protein